MSPVALLVALVASAAPEVVPHLGDLELTAADLSAMADDLATELSPWLAKRPTRATVSFGGLSNRSSRHIQGRLVAAAVEKKILADDVAPVAADAKQADLRVNGTYREHVVRADDRMERFYKLSVELIRNADGERLWSAERVIHRVFVFPAVAALLQQLQGSPVEHDQAIAIASYMGAAVRTVVGRLLDDLAGGDEQTKIRAIDDLSGLRGDEDQKQRALDLILILAQAPGSPAIRTAAIRALDSSDASMAALLRIVQSEQDALRLTAVGCAPATDARFIPALLALATGADQALATAARYGLERLQFDRAPNQSEVVAVLRRAAAGSDAAVAREASFRLALLDDFSPRCDELVRALEVDGTPILEREHRHTTARDIENNLMRCAGEADQALADRAFTIVARSVTLEDSAALEALRIRHSAKPPHDAVERTVQLILSVLSRAPLAERSDLRYLDPLVLSSDARLRAAVYRRLYALDGSLFPFFVERMSSLTSTRPGLLAEVDLELDDPRNATAMAAAIDRGPPLFKLAARRMLEHGNKGIALLVAIMGSDGIGKQSILNPCPLDPALTPLFIWFTRDPDSSDAYGAAMKLAALAPREPAAIAALGRLAGHPGWGTGLMDAIKAGLAKMGPGETPVPDAITKRSEAEIAVWFGEEEARLLSDVERAIALGARARHCAREQAYDDARAAMRRLPSLGERGRTALRAHAAERQNKKAPCAGSLAALARELAQDEGQSGGAKR